MSGFIVRRLLAGLATLIVASFLVFLLVAASGNPLANLYANPHISPATTGTLNVFTDGLQHTVLPVITLVLITYAGWSRYQRSAMLDVLNADYVRLARAKGLTPRRVLYVHALRNALIPVTTVIALDF